MSELRELGDIADIVRGISFPKEAKSLESLPDHVACLRTTNVQSVVDWDDLWFVPADRVKRGDQYVRPGDILISTANSYELVGKVAFVSETPRPATLGAFISLIRTSGEADPRFLYFQLAWTRTQQRIKDAASTTTNISNVSTKKLAALRLSVPSPDSQQRIVAEIEKQFSRLDEAVACLKRVDNNVKRYTAATLTDAVEGRLVPIEHELARGAGRSYETGDELLRRLLTARRHQWTGQGRYVEPQHPDPGKLPALPKGWTWARLDALTAIKGGVTVDRKRRNPTARPVPYLRVANVQRGFLDLDEIKFIDARETEIRELKLCPGDVLFNEGGDRDKLGRGWVWEGQLPECIHQNHVFRARPFTNDVSSKLISWWGNTFGKEYFLREGKQTTNLASINLTKLSALPVPIPPLAEQHRIVAEVDRRLSIVREVQAEVDANLKRAQALRQAILARAFGG